MKIIKKNSKIKSTGQKVIEVHVHNPGMSFDDAKRIAQKISDENAKKKSGTIYCSLKYNTGYMGKEGTQLGSPVKLFTYDGYDDEKNIKYAQDTFNDMYFFIKLYNSKTGGKDEHNDCLFYCISRMLNGKLPEKYDKPEYLKTWLHLKRDDPIDISLIDQIEKYYKVNINIVGDHMKISQANYPKSFDIYLVDGHYSLPIDRKKMNQLNKGYKYSRKLVATYYVEDDKVWIYNKKKVTEMNYLQLKQFRAETKQTHILIKAADKDVIKSYDEYIKNTKTILNATNGVIDLYKSASLHCHVKSLFHSKSYDTEFPEEINQLESAFLKPKGALMHAKQGTYENVYDYDIRSMYPYIMTLIMFPMKCGSFTKLDSLPEKLEYGIYLCKIAPSNDENTNGLFRFNTDNIYTHYDIMSARLLGLDIKLIEKSPNCLIYSKDNLGYGSKIFKPTVAYVSNRK
jgi:hypothetical protein